MKPFKDPQIIWCFFRSSNLDDEIFHLKKINNPGSLTKSQDAQRWFSKEKCHRLGGVGQGEGEKYKC
jgi:hypothetical protein